MQGEKRNIESTVNEEQGSHPDISLGKLSYLFEQHLLNVVYY